MRFSQLVVAALSAPSCVDGTSKDEVVEDTTVASFGGMHSKNEENHLSMASMLAKAGVNPSDWIDPSTQATELRNMESEIDHASREDDDDDDDDDLTVDIGVLSMERQLSTECESYPVLNQTGEWSSEDFQDLVYHCYSDSPYPEDCPDEYSVGLHCWNTSLMTDMSDAFYDLTLFNDDISSWDTGSVTDLYGTFYRASSFNVDISSWNTGSVTDLSRTFKDASSFNSDISAWDTGNVTSLTETFRRASSFNSDISSWDTGKVTVLSRTFEFASSFNSDMSSWDTGKVLRMEGTFSRASSFNSDISSWDTGRVRDFDFTFSYAFSFNSDISSWDTGKVTSMHLTFSSASSFNSDISSWDTGKVTDLSWTFHRASSFNSDISSWNTGGVTDLFRTFGEAHSFNVDISSWNTSNVLTMYSMFFNATGFNQCLGSWAANSPKLFSTKRMLYGTACPNQSDPDPNKGPWCQGFEERCFGDCIDVKEFRFGKNDRKSCDSINDITAPTEKKLKKNIRRFCKRKAFRHEQEEATRKKPIRVKDVCQEACGSRGFGPGKRCDFDSALELRFV